MSRAKLVRVPMPDYVECVKCRANINVVNDGPALHAAQDHPRANVAKLYVPAPDRCVYDDSEDATA